MLAPPFYFFLLIIYLEQFCTIELSEKMGIFYICTVKYGTHKPWWLLSTYYAASTTEKVNFQFILF